MSVRFSRVKMKSGDKTGLFLIGGAPCSQKDFEGWTAYESFCEGLDKDAPLSASVETFEYGEGETFDATPEEVAYFYMRCEKRPDFIEARTKKTAEYELLL